MSRFEQSRKEGMSGELRFRDLLESLGFVVEDSTFFQNTKEHIDFLVKSGHGDFSVDVKARKRASRSDDAVDDEYTWIEFQNVRGDLGWLYGEADRIAFEVSDGFLLVDRKDLVRFCETRVNFSQRANNPYSAIYKTYSRKGREDLITRIETSEIRKLESCKLIA
tara:strand:+ start:24045 stop:24539 length:495 start_codon:yes stop_codon:yes gene_type:complete